MRPIEKHFMLAVTDNYLRNIATSIAATEAAAFASTKTPDGWRSELIRHIRPDNCDDEKRAAAINAFANFGMKCLKQGSDQYINVGNSQFCLVFLLRDEVIVRGFAAWIVPAKDEDEARAKLVLVQGRRL